MMSIADETRYQRHRRVRDAQSVGATALHEFLLPMVLFGSMGAITWAIRGTDGYGGVDGTVVPGLMWGLLWYYLCWRKGIDARSIVFWLGMGIALGGELGYGQYVSWIQGNFQVAGETIPVSPSAGYVWFALCGIGWAAPGGILLGWALSNRASAGHWALRAALLILLLVVLFADLKWPITVWFGDRFRGACPVLLFPNAHLGIYGGELCGDLARTVRTNTQNFLVVLWWVAALVLAGIKRDKATLVAGLVIGGGFGIGFMLSALWCLGYTHAPQYIDWWKIWELNAGFNLGLLYVVTLNWAIRQTDKTYSKGGATTTGAEPLSSSIQWRDTPCLAVGGSALLFLTGYEHFYWTGVGLAVLWAAALCLATFRFGRADGAAVRRRGVSLVYAVFLYLFILFHGGTSRAGVLLELYKAEDVGQYAWPAARIWLFAPVAFILVCGALFKMWQVTRPEAGQWLSTPARLPARMIDLMTVTGFVGALTIWPSEIGVLYALLLCFALAALMRINRRLDAGE